MNTLYRQFIVATITILSVSIIVGLTLANIVYVVYTQQKVTSNNIKTAQSIVDNMEHLHDYETLKPYLHSVSKLGYQLFIVDSQGNQEHFGNPFDSYHIEPAIVQAVLNGELYEGKQSFWMMNHFSNALENTVGVPLALEHNSYALFMKPSSQLLFSDFHTILLGFILAVMVLSIIGVVWMTKHLIRPITLLTEATKALSNENFNYELNIKRNDEIGQLIEAFHDMRVQLKHNEEARKAFISNVSHDFQSPLLNIQGYAELLLDSNVTAQQRKMYVEIINEEAKRLANLTKQLLLLTSLDQDRYPLKLEKVRVDEQLKQLVRRYQWRLAEQNIELSYKLEQAELVTDKELLMNVWDNLLTNAIKYNRENGSIHVACSAHNDVVEVSFTDEGLGIAEQDLALIFERFYQVDHARKSDGSGLGLSIVDQIAKLLGAQVSVVSEVNKGSSFTVQFKNKE